VSSSPGWMSRTAVRFAMNPARDLSPDLTSKCSSVNTTRQFASQLWFTKQSRGKRAWPSKACNTCRTSSSSSGPELVLEAVSASSCLSSSLSCSSSPLEQSLSSLFLRASTSSIAGMILLTFLRAFARLLSVAA
jgi:hypothetical protein